MMQFFSGLYILAPIALHFVPESPKWLVSTGKPSRIREAKAILIEAAKENGLEIKDEDINLPVSQHQERESFLIAFKSPILLRRTLILWFNWFTVSFIIYGLTLNWRELTGSVFLNFVVAGSLGRDSPIVKH
jgi:OCT family organic cation transporter-like MFS transporter 4/5